MVVGVVTVSLEDPGSTDAEDTVVLVESQGRLPRSP